MGLSRLDNFLKNARGNILYVNPNDLDSTDSVENRGNSLTRPFKTIQRALIEAARFSYQRGAENDRFGKTTILVYPGEHIVDNRPGWIPTGTVGANVRYTLRNGATSQDLSQFDLTTNFDLRSSNNILYKLNSIHGGVIIPRGTSIVGLDLRKTVIRPKYVPNPENDNIERSAIFRVTGACYMWQFTILDSNPNEFAYKDYTSNIFIPNFSHHKLTCFEYADGVNPINIDDAFLNYSSDKTDLDVYYEKVGLVYGSSSGREIEPDYPVDPIDIEPKIDEFRIVGPKIGEIGISSIKSGDGSIPTNVVTVTLQDEFPGLDVDTAFEISGISDSSYNGQFVVSTKSSSTEFTYKLQNPPVNALPSTTGSLITLNVDTTTSASPYIFNISMRSVFGMCGMHADGSKADGFKSMVVAQFTGIGLQKDNNAFIKYESSSGQYRDTTSAGNENIHTDSRAVFKPSYENYHIKASNNSFIQIVSVFAIGYAQHFLAESGGDLSITNSNSNFGAKSLVSKGFRNNAFIRDDVGYITHIIPPKEIESVDSGIEFFSIDTTKTIGVGFTNRLYLYNETNSDIPPESNNQGYRIGARNNDTLNILVSVNGEETEYSSRITLPDVIPFSHEFSEKKEFEVGRSSGINSITSNVITLTEPHSFINGETVRIISENGNLPDGLIPNQIYYAITSGLGTDQVKIAQSLNDAINTSGITLNNKGGVLKIQSRVSDKESGDIGHPIQYDTSENQWYVNVSSSSTDNSIYGTIVGLGTTGLGLSTPRSYIKRKVDTRGSTDKIYRLRYFIPAGTGITSARPPIDGFVLQESNSTTGFSNAEVDYQFTPNTVVLDNINQLRNQKLIASASWVLGTATVRSEVPHELSVGSEVQILNVISSNNLTGEDNSGYNGTFVVKSIVSRKEFTIDITSNPGTFQNDTSSRTTVSPSFKRKKYGETFYVYRSQQIKRYIPGQQDGIYHLVVVNSSNSPTVTPFTDQNFSQPIQNLFPQTNRDNPISDPNASKSFAIPSNIGQVIIDEPQHSLTKESLQKQISEFGVGLGVTDIVSNPVGTSHTIHTAYEHGLYPVTRVSIANSGSGYGSGIDQTLYNATLVGFAGSTTGQNATARVTVNIAGNITDIQIIDGGSCYGIGNTLSVTGIATTSGFSSAVITVDSIIDSTGDSIEIYGCSDESFNTLYRVESNSNDPKKIVVSTPSSILGISTIGIGADSLEDALLTVNGKTLDVSSLSYDNNSGIATIVTSSAHGLTVDNKIIITGANQDVYNGEFITKRINSTTSFNAFIGITTNSPTATGTIRIYNKGLTSQAGFISPENENVLGRQISFISNVRTTLSGDITSKTSENVVNLTNVEDYNLKIGDYLQINDEIVRIKETVSSNPITVFRGALGTNPNTHSIGDVVKKISVKPVEFRRNSIIRASGHTFEYLGYGPGNYSTALPERQDREVTQIEELLAQSTRYDGGITVFTGMNDSGDLYVGNKKVNSATGQEEVFDSPVPTVTGDDVFSGLSVGFDAITPLEINVSRSIKVEGGENTNLISEFSGPVVFNNKVVSTSDKGLEASSLFLQGDTTVSRNITVRRSKPTLAGNPGDISFNSNPNPGETIGYVYTTNNKWHRFGSISLFENSNIGIFDAVGIATNSVGNCKLKVGAGTSLFCVDENGVGIGTTANTYKLNVNGNTNISGTLTIGDDLSIRHITASGIVTASAFVGDGSGLSNLPNDSLWDVSGNKIYPLPSVDYVGIKTINPTYPLDIGFAGSTNTDLRVRSRSLFAGLLTADDITITGDITATTGTFNIQNTSGTLVGGNLTANSLLKVGSGGATLYANASTGRVGIKQSSPTFDFEVNGSARFKTYSENVVTLSSSSSVTINLSSGQTFQMTTSTNTSQFILSNIPSGATAFTLKITQGSTARTVAIDVFKTSGGVTIPVYWPGGVVPVVTASANKTDVYSFMTFDGGATLYGVVGGQNFA